MDEYGATMNVLIHGTRLSTVFMHNNAKVDSPAEALSKPCCLMSFLDLVLCFLLSQAMEVV